MGLRYIHFIFIALAVLCTLVFGLWALFTSHPVLGGWGRLGGGASALLGVALAAYGIWFWRKSKRVLS